MISPDKTLPAWKECQALERVQDALLLLSVHSFLSHAEVAKVRGRIEKWLEKHEAEKS